MDIFELGPEEEGPREEGQQQEKLFFTHLETTPNSVTIIIVSGYF